jgi:hypothetical protein
MFSLCKKETAFFSSNIIILQIYKWIKYFMSFVPVYADLQIYYKAAAR